MLYVKHDTKSGKEKFIPILDNSVYVFCDRCEQMVLIPDPAGYIYELGACSDSIPLIVKVVVSKKLRNFVAICSSCLSGFTGTCIVDGCDRTTCDHSNVGIVCSQKEHIK